MRMRKCLSTFVSDSVCGGGRAEKLEVASTETEQNAGKLTEAQSERR